jgi:hypothetical protein
MMFALLRWFKPVHVSVLELRCRRNFDANQPVSQKRFYECISLQTLFLLFF